MSVESYWMGKDLDLDSLWRDFDEGTGYIQKVASRPLHLLRLTFGEHPAHLPLFDHEVLFKTVKGTFHDVKAECFTSEEYDKLIPIFLHRVERGSGIFEFLAELTPLLAWVNALGAVAAVATVIHVYLPDDLKIREADEKSLLFIRDNFPGSTPADFEAYTKARKTSTRRQVLKRLLEQHLKGVEVSPRQYEPSQPPTLIDMQPIMKLEPGEKDIKPSSEDDLNNKS
jgi:hypothetical protein